MKKDNLKRLSMDLDPTIHKQIKMIVAERDTTITEWVSEAIKDRIRKEIDWGNLTE